MRQAYCAHVYAQAGSYEAAARRLGLNWRTVQLHARAWANHARSLDPARLMPNRPGRTKGG
jgi:hypothetical protein